MNLSKIGCQEANSLGIVVNGEPVPCGQPGAKVVFHQHDGRNVYVMCLPCASHNIRNRGGVELTLIGSCPECGSPDPDEIHTSNCSIGKQGD